MRGALLGALIAVLPCAACAASQAAAARDPMRCERDPKCTQKTRAFDCNEQCADDPACIDRCNQVQEQTGASAPH